MPHFPAERRILTSQISNRLNQIQGSIYRKRLPIDGWETVITGHMQDVSPIPTEGWESFTIGSPWGGVDITQWFRASVTIPEEYAGQKAVVLLRPGSESSGDSLCYVDGVPMQGLDRNRMEVVLAENAEAGRTYQIHIEAYASPYQQPGAPHNYVFGVANMAVRDDVAQEFYWDLKVAFDVMSILDEETQTRQRMQDLIDRTVKAIDLNALADIDGYHAQIAAAQASFREEMKKYQTPGEGHVTMFGHSHIDTAWLWPLRETRRKCSRTFSTVLKYMKEYPDYHFTQSQPQLYEFIKDNYPTIWEGIKERVKEGRWEPNGGGWVEQDSNVAGGEALVRQYLYGNRFYRKEFGIHTRVVWIPDSFGFPICMPQIWKKSQMEAFGTTKLGWNQYNDYPYHLFRWRGLDGSEILTVMHPGTYCGDINPGSIRDQWRRFKQKDLSDDVWFSFGHGDGGGGPTVSMLENAKRISKMTGLPENEIDTLQSSYDRIKESADWDKLPVLHDEMYFELHRGCQTSQARMKRGNRKSELAMRDAEMLSTLAMAHGAEYPQESLYDVWKLLLTGQFHDILPGTSVTEVYDDAARHHAQILKTAADATKSALAAIAADIDTEGEGEALLVQNTLGWNRDDVATVAATLPEGATVVNPQGEAVPCQAVKNIDGSDAVIFEAAGVPSVGHAVYRIAEGAAADVSGLAVEIKDGGVVLSNDFSTVELGPKGTITRLYDKENAREVLPEGTEANELLLFDDRPNNWEAWDVDFNIDENKWSIDDVVSMTVVEEGPVRATVRVVKKTEKSTITQDISLWRTSRRIDFVTEVDWHEQRRLLKAAFPVDVLSRNATYEVQYGAIERPTHFSNSIDRAKFEVPGHRWIDLSESDYGVSLLNDCKYGFNTHENVMRISLLRSPMDPDPVADQGHHSFTYSMYPHAETWREAETVRRAYELNAPLLVQAVEASAGSVPAVAGSMSVDKPEVVIDAVKKAEDSDAVIVRVYESHGGRGPVKLTFADAPSSVTECDLMEENDTAVELSGDTVSFFIKPWEIRTFKVVK